MGHKICTDDLSLMWRSENGLWPLVPLFYDVGELCKSGLFGKCPDLLRHLTSPNQLLNGIDCIYCEFNIILMQVHIQVAKEHLLTALLFSIGWPWHIC